MDFQLLKMFRYDLLMMWSEHFILFIYLIFVDCRIRGGIEGIHIIRNRNGKSMGQAFIELEHEEDVCKALDLHKHYLGQRFVEGKQ